MAWPLWNQLCISITLYTVCVMMHAKTPLLPVKRAGHCVAFVGLHSVCHNIACKHVCWTERTLVCFSQSGWIQGAVMEMTVAQDPILLLICFAANVWALQEESECSSSMYMRFCIVSTLKISHINMDMCKTPLLIQHLNDLFTCFIPSSR